MPPEIESRYKVVTARTLHFLEGKVDHGILAGWVPIGCVVVLPRHCPYREDIEYAQTMWHPPNVA